MAICKEELIVEDEANYVREKYLAPRYFLGVSEIGSVAFAHTIKRRAAKRFSQADMIGAIGLARLSSLS